jgi:hypothetical protein
LAGLTHFTADTVATIDGTTTAVADAAAVFARAGAALNRQATGTADTHMVVANPVARTGGITGKLSTTAVANFAATVLAARTAADE